MKGQDYSSDYRTRLVNIDIYTEIADFIKSLKQPSDKFNILNYVGFTMGTTNIRLYPKINYKPHLQTTNYQTTFFGFIFLPFTSVMELLAPNRTVSVSSRRCLYDNTFRTFQLGKHYC